MANPTDAVSPHPTINSLTPDWIVRLLRTGDDDLPVVQAARQEFNIRRARAADDLDFDTIRHPEKYDADAEGKEASAALKAARERVEEIEEEIDNLKSDLRDAEYEVQRLEKGGKP